MAELKCPFSILQAAGSCGCSRGREVVRRGGAEFDCTDAGAHTACTTLAAHLKNAALPALGHVDDLTQTPKSVYERVLLGGLQGLRLAADPADDAPETRDIWAVVEAARGRYPSLDRIPEADFVSAIEACRIRRRRQRD